MQKSKNATLAVIVVILLYGLIAKFNISTELGNIYLYAMTFAFDRYAATLMPMRFVMMGIGIYLCVEVLRKIFNQVELKEG